MVYVDGMTTHRGNRKWCHLIADTSEELEQIARELRLKPDWLQDAGTYKEHYDLSARKRKHAVELGAIPIGFGEMGRIVHGKLILSACAT